MEDDGGKLCDIRRVLEIEANKGSSMFTGSGCKEVSDSRVVP